MTERELWGEIDDAGRWSPAQSSINDELVARFTGIMQTAREPEDQARQLVTLLVLDYRVERRAT